MYDVRNGLDVVGISTRRQQVGWTGASRWSWTGWTGWTGAGLVCVAGLKNKNTVYSNLRLVAYFLLYGIRYTLQHL